MPTNVVVLNGGSSSGKSSIARRLQTLLNDPWLTFGVDTLVEALPESMSAGIARAADGQVVVGADFRMLDVAWAAGIAAMAAAGARVILDEVFLGAAQSQQRWLDALAGLNVLWVGVRCDVAEASRRESERRDRRVGMAARQALAVHDGVRYDIEIDTTRASVAVCAAAIAELLESADTVNS